MTSTFFGIEIASRGLAVSQVGEDVTGQNIANANTPGYSVQSVDQIASDPLTPPDAADHVHAGMLGTGVIASTITRASDQFLNVQVRDATSSKSMETTQQNALQQVENAFAEPSDTGLANTYNTFFQNFNQLANNPDDLGVRTSVVQSGNAVAKVFQSIQHTLDVQGQQLATNVSDDMTALNGYGKQIAALNVTIRQATAQNQSANDLMDQRDVLIDKVSALANVTVLNKSDGTVNLSIGSTDLVVGTDASNVSLTGSNGLITRGDLTSGALAGLQQSQTALAGYQSDLDTLAATTISQVNAVHSTGAGLDGTTGLNFFTGTDARTININPVLVANPDKLAAAALPTSGSVPPGDGSNAVLIAGLESKSMTITSATFGTQANVTMPNFYQEMISDMGAKAAAAKTAGDTSGANLTQLTNQRASVTGVSSDTELANMLKYQRAYQASAQVIKTMDSLLDTLINTMMG